ncbi:alcohol dehydrogenase class-3-like [Oppia nitens]|uniref:alcohol dehydrogenase class-3-like n=1 Tax=Oppia nitens TaxID=1686743 RepID=UPI0023DB2AAF|nr:alcohol dehydrogenase class-3-like [Oppia nitens]
MATIGQPIKCKGAVFRWPNQPLVIEELVVAAPKSGEVRVKLYASGVCRSDASTIWGQRSDSHIPYGQPMINGHEGAGIVESVGPGVTADDDDGVQVGDHVVLLWRPQCNQCPLCLNPLTNDCQLAVGKGDCEQGWLPDDGISRYRTVGTNEPILTPSTNVNLATFVQYAIVRPEMLAKVDDHSLPLDVMSVFGCCLPTGYGAAHNIARVNPGSTCLVWGLGAVGLAVVLGCKFRDALTIIGVDVNEDKQVTAQPFGLTHFINAGQQSMDQIYDTVRQLTDGLGVDYAFDCIAKPNTMDTSLKCLATWGTFVSVGLVQRDDVIELSSGRLLDGLTLTGGLYGKYKGKDGVLELIRKYRNDKLFHQLVDQFVSNRYQLNDINKAIDDLKINIININTLTADDDVDHHHNIRVDIPRDLTPEKSALFWQRQLLILFVPTNGGLGLVPGGPGVIGPGAIGPGAIGPNGLPQGVGGLPVGGGGFNGRLQNNRNVERLRTLRRRTRIRVTTSSYDSGLEQENK